MLNNMVYPMCSTFFSLSLVLHSSSSVVTGVRKRIAFNYLRQIGASFFQRTFQQNIKNMQIAMDRLPWSQQAGIYMF
jgi:hypothetical protein